MPSVDDILGPAPAKAKPTVDSILGPAEDSLSAQQARVRAAGPPKPAAPAKATPWYDQKDASGWSLSDVPAEIGKQWMGAARDLKKFATHPVQAANDAARTRAQNPAENLPSTNLPGQDLAARLLGDAVTVTPIGAPVTGTVSSVIGRPVEKATGGAVSKEMATNALLLAAGANHMAAEPAARGASASAEAAARVAPKPAVDEVLGPAPKKPRTVAAAEKPTVDELLGPATKKRATVDAPPVKPGEFDVPSGGKPLLNRKPGITLDESNPGPVYERGRGKETPFETAQRVDDALYRLKNSAVADKLELQQRVAEDTKANPQLTDQAVGKRFIDAVEQRMITPGAAIPEDLQGYHAAVKPLDDEATSLQNELRARGTPDEELTPYRGMEQGYLHRIARGKGHIFDEADTEGMGDRDVITGARRGLVGNKSLARTTASQKARTYAVLVDPETGARQFVEGDEYKPGTTIPGSFGKEYRVEQATTSEIEANTDTRYHHNPYLAAVDNLARLRRVKRNLDVLDNLVDDAKARGLAHRAEWHYQNDQGQWVRARANTPTPKGFRETTVPQLKGVYFDPRIADTLEDFYGKDRGDLDGKLTKLNRLLTSSLFITPVPHALNVMGHWAVGRGWDWVNPAGYARMARYGTRAMQEVLSGGKDYRAMLREGSGLLYGDIATENFHKVLLEKLAGDIATDPKLDEAAKGFGLKDAAQLGKAVYDAVYKTSNRMLWAANDIFMLQRQYELMDKGMKPREAIREAERDIPNYRIPPQVMGQRWLTEALRSPNYTLFGRYKYGMFKAYGSMFRDIFRGSAKERVDAVGKFVALIGLATVALPMADKVVQAITGNKDAKVRRFGPLSVPQAVADFTQGQRDWAGMLASIITPAPATVGAYNIAFDRDLFTGRHIIEPESTLQGQMLQGAEAAADKFYPTQLALDAARQQNPQDALAREAGKLVGVDVPPANREAGRMKAKKYDRRMARSREKKDPLERMIRSAEQ